MKRVGGFVANTPIVAKFLWHAFAGHPVNQVKRVPGFVRNVYYECECGAFDVTPPNGRKEATE